MSPSTWLSSLKVPSRRTRSTRRRKRRTNRRLGFEWLEERAMLTTVIDLLDHEQNVLVYGDPTLARDGAVVTGDVNGDGVDDLILGSRNGDGPDGSRQAAGEVYVFYGGDELGSTRDVVGTHGFAPDVLVYGANSSDQLTTDGALTVGDVNGDGIDDLVFGSRFAGAQDNFQAPGEAYIVFGSTNLASTIDLANGEEDVVIYGGAPLDARGDNLTSDGALTVGDVNGDGIDDVILGAWNADGPGESRIEAGEAYVIFGSTSMASTIDLANGEEDVLIYGAGLIDRLTNGGAITVGDVSGDGIDDLIVGASLGGSGAGEAYVIFGSTSMASTIDLANGDQNVTVYGATSGDFLTLHGALAVGDTNGDGIDDLILGAQAADGPGEARSGAGEAYIILGSTTMASTFDLANGDQDVLIQGATAFDGLTQDGALTVGDLNGDGIGDLILGAYGADGPAEARPLAGEAYVIFGSLSMAPTIDLANADEDVLIQGATASDQLTRYAALTVGDTNGDGIDDLILGAAFADGPGETRPIAGEAYVIFGSTSPMSSTIDLANGEEDVLIQGITDERLTIDGALAVGDVTGDGIDDIILGSPFADRPSEGPHFNTFGAGRAYVISLTVPVLSPQDQVQNLIAAVANLGLTTGTTNALTATLSAAQKSLNNGNVNGALSQIGAFVHQVNAFLRSSKLTEFDGEELIFDAENAAFQLAADQLFADVDELLAV